MISRVKFLQAEAYAGIFWDADVAHSAKSLLAGAVTEGPTAVGVYKVTASGTVRVTTELAKIYGVVET